MLFGNDAKTLLLITRLDDLREQWETSHAASRDNLYNILSQCLRIAEDCRKDAEKEQALNDALSARTITGLGRKKFEAKVVSYVFDLKSDRRRCHVYARVLLSANREHVKPADFADWIKHKGGIERVRRAQSPNQNSPNRKQLIADAKSRLEKQRPSGPTFTLDANFRHGVGYEQPLSVAIVRIDNRGKAQIAWGTAEKEVLDLLLARAGKEFQGKASAANRDQIRRDKKAAERADVIDFAERAAARDLASAPDPTSQQ